MTDIAPSLTLHPSKLDAIPTNSNTHDQRNLEELAESRRLFGQFKNVVVWSPPERMEVETAEGETVTLKPTIKYVIAGNGFHQASLERGYDEIEVKDYTGRLTYEEALLLMEADNASPLGSQPNPAQMAANLERARGLYADNERMSAMLERARELVGATNGNGTGEGADADPQIDRAGELQEKWGTALGQVWRLGEHRLVCGDCTDPAVVEAVMQGERAEMMFTDPPYGVDKAEWDEIFPDEKVWERHKRYLLQGANVLIFPGEANLPYKINILFDVFDYQWPIVWYKPNAMQFGKTGYTVQSIAWWLSVGDPLHRPKCKDVIVDAIVPQKNIYGHPSPKNVNVVKELIKELSKESDLISDPFSGSGTTIIAAHNLQRRARCVEIDPGYVAVSLERFYEATQIEPELL